MLAYASMDLRFFHRLGATLLDRKPLCGGVRTEAWLGTYGAMPGMPPEQAALAKLIIAWGNNVTYCNLHFTSIMHEARRNGAKLVVVDPRRTKIAEQADLHLALRPGTDVVLAWAVTAELERRGALDRDFIERHVHGFEEYMARARRVPWPRPRGPAGCRRRRSASSSTGTRRSRRRRSASATGSSATRTAGAASGRSSPCRPWPGSSASPAAAS